jgi:hypothetical protein
MQDRKRPDWTKWGVSRWEHAWFDPIKTRYARFGVTSRLVESSSAFFQKYEETQQHGALALELVRNINASRISG